jgi:glycerol-3-phosphate acyltransferase PlsY
MASHAFKWGVGVTITWLVASVWLSKYFQINSITPFLLFAPVWLAGGDEEKRTTGRNTMIYGIVAIFVILSVWGLVNILNGTFGTANQSNPQQLPNLPQPR